MMENMKYKVGDRICSKFHKSSNDIEIIEVLTMIDGKCCYRVKNHETNQKYLIWEYDMSDYKLVEEETKQEYDYVTAMNDLMGLEIEKSCILNEFDEYKKAVEEHGYFSEEAFARKCFIHLRKIGTAQNVLENFGFNLPDGYIFKDENGNVINATKIVLEKKKKEYPKTYEECCKVLGVNPNNYLSIRNPCCNDGDEDCTNYELGLLGIFDSLWVLRFCRDAYWKIAGEEMGLGKPWEPDWSNPEQLKHTIYYYKGDIKKDYWHCHGHILAFPTEEMMEEFHENFKKEIEICKELL